MLVVESRLIRLGCSARSKEDAIAQAAVLLAENDCVDPRYAESMLGREHQTATYLGNGIAIPHGLRRDADLIRKTAVAVLQFPEGVAWGNETVRLVVGIAAVSDEHIQVLARLTGVLQDQALAERLWLTRDPAEIAAVLNGEAAPRETPAAVEIESRLGNGLIERADALVTGHAGLHARPATLFAGLAKQFESAVEVHLDGKRANGKAMASLLTLGASRGSRLAILAAGPDAARAVRALAAAVEDGLGDEWVAEIGGNAAAPPPLEFEGETRQASAAAPGLGLGPIFHRHRPAARTESPAGSPALERERLEEALAVARAELKELNANTSARLGSKNAAIFLAHQELVDDPDLQAAAFAAIENGTGAGFAWKQATDARADLLAAEPDKLLAARAADLRDVGARVVRILSGVDGNLHPLPEGAFILVAEDLAPSDTVGLDPERVQALVTARGGPNSHTAILARSLGLPAVAGAGDWVLGLDDGTEAIVDGDTGRILLAPSAEDLRRAGEAIAARRQFAEDTRRAAYRPAYTSDGRRLETVANIGTPEEAARAVEAGAEGVGLLRTEFLFLDREAPPGEEEQYEALLTMVRALNGLPLIVRTLDIGGDKDIPYLALAREDNPFLGIRGLRLCLERPDLFQPQLRAIVRASKAAPEGAIKVMFPMVATLAEFREAKAALEVVRAELGGPRLDCGIMVEVPSAALMAGIFAEEVDFFSIGTNDLTQYTLAMDRLHPALARRADGLDPAVLRLIATVVEAAHAKGRWVGVCGNMAAEPAAAPILIGLGVDELSVSPPAVPGLKALIRDLSMARAKRLAARALACGSAGEVRALA